MTGMLVGLLLRCINPAASGFLDGSAGNPLSLAIIDLIHAAMPATETLTLDQCDKRRCFQIVTLLPQPRFGAQDGQVTMRLKELGFLPGNRVTVIGFGLLGRDPLAVQVNGTKFALRSTEAAKVLVQPVDA